MTHPLAQFSTEQQRRLFVIFLLGTIGLALVMSITARPLYTPQAAGGIVSFEFAWTVDGAAEIIDSWDETARIHAGFIQGLDYLFLVVYAQSFALACLLAGKRLQQRHWPGANLAQSLAWGMWLAAILDAIENFALVSLLFGNLAQPWPQLAGICAAVKFFLLAIGLLYMLMGWLSGWMQPAQH